MTDFFRGIPPKTLDEVILYLDELGIRLEEAFSTFELGQLDNVDLDTILPVGADNLTFNATTGLWEPAAAGGSSPLTTKGDLYGYSTVDARLPIGSDDDILIADSAQALGVRWGAAPGGGAGAWEEISETAITAVASIDITWDETAYEEVKFVIKDMQVDTDSVSVFVRVGSGNGTTIYSGSTTYRGVYNGLTTTWNAMAGGTTQFALCYSSMGNAAGEYLNGDLVVKAFASANTGCLLESMVQFYSSAGGRLYVRTHGDFYGTAIAIDTVRFFPEAGSFAAGGTIKLYGLKV